jgi:hypothetical protein
MALGNAKNIVVGAGALYIGHTTDIELTENDLPKAVESLSTCTESLQDPDNVDIWSSTNSAGKWDSVGYTSEGAELSFEPDYGEVQVDQLLDVAKIFKQGQRVMLNTTLAEATLENFLVAIGGKSSDLVNTMGSPIQSVSLNGGALGYSPVERSIAIVGPGPDQKKTAAAKNSVERVYIGYRALSMETVTVGVRRNEATVFPVTLRLLASSAEAGEAPDGNASYGKIIDRAYNNVAQP